MQHAETLIIERRFNGPPTSSNGGWAAGALAKHLSADSISVSLRAPPPLEVPLELRRQADGSVSLMWDQVLIAQAQAAEFELTVPAPPNLDEARAAGERELSLGLGRPSWPYSHCFGCGAFRQDGMRITPGPIGSIGPIGPIGPTGVVAAAWTPDASLIDPASTNVDEIRIEAIWAALDCPAGIAWSFALPQNQPMVTARIIARIDARPKRGQTYIVMGWPIERDGRKLHAGSALVASNGQILAKTLQLWLLPKPGQEGPGAP